MRPVTPLCLPVALSACSTLATGNPGISSISRNARQRSIDIEAKKPSHRNRPRRQLIVRPVIKRIRKKFQNVHPGFGHIENHAGFGFRWTIAS
jgi:hypothetical protein